MYPFLELKWLICNTKEENWLFKTKYLQSCEKICKSWLIIKFDLYLYLLWIHENKRDFEQNMAFLVY